MIDQLLRPSTLLLLALETVAIFTAWGSEPQPDPTATPNIPAIAKRSRGKNSLRRLIFFLLVAAGVILLAACGPGDCGSLCDGDFWLTANLSDVRAELDTGADVNGKNLEGWAPLPLAVVYDRRPAIIELLIDQGAYVNAKGVQYQTPLLWAVLEPSPGTNRTNIVRVLLNKGADVNVRGPAGFTPLHFAIMNELNPGVIVLMLDKGANVKSKNEYGTTVFHAAAWRSSPEVIELLLKRYTDITARNDDGTTACQIAVEEKRPVSVLNLLCQR